MLVELCILDFSFPEGVGPAAGSLESGVACYAAVACLAHDAASAVLLWPRGHPGAYRGPRTGGLC